jgi:hypothetical protein
VTEEEPEGAKEERLGGSRENSSGSVKSSVKPFVTWGGDIGDFVGEVSREDGTAAAGSSDVRANEGGGPGEKSSSDAEYGSAP